MSSIELTSSQRTILTALVDLYRGEEDAIKGEAIAAEVDRNPGTIRNQMQSLKALQLVEGVPGPKGGYRPTAAAYEALDVEPIDQPAEVPLRLDGERAEGLTVEEIDLTNVHHPDMCRAEVRVRGSLDGLHEGDAIEVGPTPLSKLVIRGTIDGIDETNSVVVVSIEGMEAPAGDPVH